MGSKNRIRLGRVSDIMSHHIKDIERNLYMTSSTAKKIKEKHFPLNIEFIDTHNFQIVIDNTIKIYYDEDKRIYNCLSKVFDRFLIFGMISKNGRTEVTTLFITNLKQIEKKFSQDKKIIEINGNKKR